MNGIDVSRYQGKIDWDKVKSAGVEFAMLKTVSTNKKFGGIYIDPEFERNYSECKRLGIPVGAYYYTYAQDMDYANAEISKFKEAVSGKIFEMPLVVDVEDNLLRPLTAEVLTNLVCYALDVIESWGCYAMVYTYTNYKNTELDFTRLAAYDLWIADYRGVKPVICGMWQSTSKGRIDGIAGNVDLNTAYKNYPEIIKKHGLYKIVQTVKLYTAEIGPMTKGDELSVYELADRLGIAYKIVKEEDFDGNE